MISKNEVEAIYPLSPMQEGLLFHSLNAPGSGYYILQGRCVFKGDLDVASFRRAWEKIIDRYAVLRTAFFLGETMAQVALRKVPVPLTVEDWSGIPEDECERRLQSYMKKDLEQGYDFSEAPLMRLWLIRTSESSHYFVWSYHHILLDAWSIALLNRELAAYYAAYSRGERLDLPAPKPYSDYISWLRRRSGSSAEAFWRRMLKGFESPTPLPVESARPIVARSYERSQQVEILPVSTTAALEAVARQNQLTLNTIVEGAWALVLACQSGQSDVVFGAIVSGRSATLPGIETMVGLFINTLPVRAKIDREECLTTWLRRLQQQQFEAQEYAYTRLVEIQGWSEVPRGKPLFECTLTFQNFRPDFADGSRQSAQTHAASASSSFRVEGMQADHKLSYPLGLLVVPDGELNLRLVYDSGRFTAVVIRQLLDRLRLVLEAIAAKPERRIAELEMLTPVERQQVLKEWNDTWRDYGEQPCIHEMFEHQAAAMPDALALVCDDLQMSYQGLNEAANRLAHYLSNLGVGAEVRVGLYLERGLDMVVGLLGVLKAGGGYVPLDPSFPVERVGQMLEDSQAAVVLTQDRLKGRLPYSWAQVVSVDEEPNEWAAESGANRGTEIAGMNLAYVIYTSGSTGKPKGVEIEHQQMVNYVMAVWERLRLEAGWRMALISTMAADLGHTMLYPSLCLGGELHIVSEECGRDRRMWEQYQSERQIECLKLTPTHLEALVGDQGALPGKRLVLGGEACSPELVRHLEQWATGCEVFNHYGPTECTVGAVTHHVTGSEDRVVPIGKPLGNVRTYVVDQVGESGLGMVPGELYIGGGGVGRGYWQEAGLTAERFVPDGLSGESGARLYRTGDLVRWRGDGELDFLGRVDHQVKLRGYRIELGEIESMLLQHGAVKQCAVILREDEAGDKRIVGYVVVDEKQQAVGAEMRKYLQGRVPDYMVPSWIVELEEMPLTPNGKVDRKALPAPEAGEGAAEGRAAKTALEEIVAGIFEEVLRREKVGVEENFFEMGGHSLLATQVVSRIREVLSVEVALRALFEAPTVAGLAEEVERERNEGRGVDAPAIEAVSRDRELPLSYAQQRLWFMQELEPESAAYNIASGVRLQGEMNQTALRQSLSEIARRHEVLRTRFEVSEGRPVQVIEEAGEVELAIWDVSEVSEEEREERVREIGREEGERPFDLEGGPVWRAGLVRMGEEENVLLVSMHHVVSDGWSTGLLVSEFTSLYESYRQGDRSRLAELEVQYADFAVWQRNWLTGEVLQQQLDYWKRQLAQVSVLELPTDRPRPAAPGHRAGFVSFSLSTDLTQQLKALSRREGVTLFMTLVAGLKVVLGRYSGQEDVVVGTDVANRNRLETEGLIGFFVNQLVLRTEVRGEASVREVLGRVREVTLGAYANQDVPFEKLVEELSPERDLGRSPLFQVKLVLQNVPQGETRAVGLNFSPFDATDGFAKLDLTLFLAEGPEGISGVAEYARDLYDAPSIAQLLGYLRRVLEAMAAQREQRVARICLMSEDERQQVLIEWNDTQVASDDRGCLHYLFEQQAERTPESVAVIAEASHLTYNGLNRRANHLGSYLRALGVEAEVRVGLCVERGLEMFIGLLGILKAGGAYLPLDPSYPSERLSYMLENAQVPVLLTQSHLRAHLPSAWVQVIELDREWEIIESCTKTDLEAEVGGENLAYIIYTSGSTGPPKGVMVPHGGLVNYLMWAAKAYRVSDCSASVVHSSISFDLTITGLFAPLLCGRAVRLIAEPDAVSSLAKAIEVSDCQAMVKLTPSQLEVVQAMLGSEKATEFGKVLVIGGEALRWEELEYWRRHAGEIRLINEYGPTETVVGCCVYEAFTEGPFTGSVPIGRPIANTQLYVLDQGQQVALRGMVGECYIGGGGVGRGYWQEAGLTAERFVPDGLSGESGARLYRTGDLVRWRGDGELDFLGRVDHQVKLRGYRIELGEIESMLLQHGAVKQCAVILREDEAGDKRIVGYVVGSGEGKVESGEMRKYLQGRLPDYMVPSWIVELEEMPLTPNGKVDRKALPAPEAGEAAAEGRAAKTALEEIVAGIFEEVLRREKVGVEENFFEMGGHSLLATQVVSRIREVLGVEVGLRALFEAPTVAGLAEEVERERNEGRGVDAPAIEAVSRDRELPLSYAQQRLWFMQELEPESAAYNIASGVRLQGEMNQTALRQSLSEIARRHEVLRTRFEVSEGRPVQVIEEAGEVELAIWDVREVSEEEREERVREIAREEGERPFDLEGGPVWRAALVRMGGEENVLLVSMHHVVSDGWSSDVIVKEITSVYEALWAGGPSPLPELAVQYADYAVWQREWLQGEVLEQELGYWKRQLAGAPSMELPTDRPRSAMRSRRGSEINFNLSTELTLQLKELSRREGVTLFMTLLAGFQIVLGRYSGQDDVVVGTDVANRNRLQAEDLIGFFVNHLVLRTDLSGNPSLRELLRRVREITLGAYAHQDMPFDKLVEELQPDRSLNYTPIFQTLFVMRNMQLRTPEAHNGHNGMVRSFPLDSSPSKYDWVVVMQETGNGISANWKYNDQLFNASTIERLCLQFQTLLASIAASPDARLSDLEMTAQSERTPERMPRPRLFAQSRPRTVTLPQENLVATSYLSAQQTMPLVVRPTVEDFDLVEWAGIEREFIETNLSKHGAILFRGFKVEGADEFERVASAICPELFADYGDLPREGIGGKVYGSTPYPNDRAILFHNESSHLHRWPLKIWFYCLTPPKQGGETPVVDCRELYRDLNPTLMQKFHDKGLLYVRNFGDKLDVSWRDFFKTSDPAAVEEFCRKAGMVCEWGTGNSLRTKKRCVAVANHPKTGERVFFNQLQAHHVSCLDPTAREVLMSQFGEAGLPRNVYYGDGETIPDSVVDELREFYESRAKSFTWEHGDILMVDNMLAAHGRRPFVGPRKIVVAMGEMINESALRLELAAR